MATTPPLPPSPHTEPPAPSPNIACFSTRTVMRCLTLSAFLCRAPAASAYSFSLLTCLSKHAVDMNCSHATRASLPHALIGLCIIMFPCMYYQVSLHLLLYMYVPSCLYKCLHLHCNPSCVCLASSDLLHMYLPLAGKHSCF